MIFPHIAARKAREDPPWEVVVIGKGTWPWGHVVGKQGSVVSCSIRSLSRIFQDFPTCIEA